VFELIRRVTGRPLRVEQKDTQRGDMRDTYADTSRARSDLAFNPTVTLEEGLRAQYEWMTAAHD
jgi:nucleoside-diphosphate-sugar epimerase